ncbi:MAG: DsbA family protein [Acidimicrobiales bacterium]
MELPPFQVSWDYRCPFARNIHEHLVTALKAGADWDVTFTPYSLSQVHVEEGEPSIWDVAATEPERLAINAGVVVRDRFSDRFLDAHRALFEARHDKGEDIREREVVAGALKSVGVDPEAVFTEIDTGWPDEAVRKAHEWAVDNHQMFGVPTFVVADEAAFVRIMQRPQGDSQLAITTIERVVKMITEHPEINELKHTSVPL